VQNAKTLNCNASEGVEKSKVKKNHLSPTRVGRLENFRAKPYEEKP
jgi:hypothetical protein